MPNVNVGDLPLISTLSSNDSLMCVSNRKAYRFKYSDLQSVIENYMASWENLQGKPFDDVSSEFFQIDTVVDGNDTYQVLTFNDNIASDFYGMKSHTGYEIGKQVSNENLHSAIDTLLNVVGYQEVYDAVEDEYSYEKTTSGRNNPNMYAAIRHIITQIGYQEVYNESTNTYTYTTPSGTGWRNEQIFNALRIVVNAIGYTLTVASNGNITVSRGDNYQQNGPMSDILLSLAGNMGYNVTKTSQGGLSLEDSHAPYHNSQLSSWLFSLISAFMPVPQYNSSTQEWTFTRDLTNVQGYQYFQAVLDYIKSNLYGGLWEAGRRYEVGCVVIRKHSGDYDILVCETANADTTFVQSHWYIIA